jgi:hypothetical protein
MNESIEPNPQRKHMEQNGDMSKKQRSDDDDRKTKQDERLSRDVLMHLMGYLLVPELACMARVCRAWRLASESCQALKDCLLIDDSDETAGQIVKRLLACGIAHPTLQRLTQRLDHLYIMASKTSNMHSDDAMMATLGALIQLPRLTTIHLSGMFNPPLYLHLQAILVERRRKAVQPYTVLRHLHLGLVAGEHFQKWLDAPIWEWLHRCALEHLVDLRLSHHPCVHKGQTLAQWFGTAPNMQELRVNLISWPGHDDNTIAWLHLCRDHMPHLHHLSICVGTPKGGITVKVVDAARELLLARPTLRSFHLSETTGGGLFTLNVDSVEVMLPSAEHFSPDSGWNKSYWHTLLPCRPNIHTLRIDNVRIHDHIFKPWVTTCCVVVE